MSQDKLLDLVEETFTDGEVLDVALYLLSAHAVGEAAHQGIAGKYSEVKGLSPQALEVAYRYESALTNNDFYMKHFSVIRSFAVFDKIKLATIMELARTAEKHDDKHIYEALKNMMQSKLESLIMVAFIWKGYDFAIDFTAKLKLISDLPEAMTKYFKQKLGY